MRIPLDDSIGEGPHSVCKRVQLHARSAGWAWAASTMRLPQNIVDIDNLVGATGCDLQEVWDRFSCVVKPPCARNPHSLLKAKRPVFEARFYNVGIALGQGGCGVDGLGDSDAGSDGGSDGQAGGSDGQGGGHEDQPDARIHRDGDDGSGNGDDRVDAPPRVGRNDDRVKLLRHFFSKSLQAYAYITIPVAADDGVSMFQQPFQVLALETKNVLVPTFEDARKEEHLFQLTIQPLQIWCDSVANGVRSVEVFVVDEPCEIDLVQLVGLDFKVRAEVHMWQASESDVGGCLSLTDMQPVRPLMPLSSADIPILSLMDELDASGFVAVSRRVNHVQGGALEYDTRGVVSKRCYFQCLLAADELWLKGIQDFSSLHSAAYYRLLLLCREPPNMPLSAKECERRIALLSGDVVQSHILRSLPRICAPSCPVNAPLDDDIAGHADIAIVDVQPLAVRDRSRSPAKPPSLSSSSSSSSSSDDDIAGAEAVAEVRELTILGVKASLEIHLARDTEGWRVRCPNLAHHECKRFRSTKMWTAQLGANACSLFLETWLADSYTKSSVQHKAWSPTLAQCKSYMDGARGFKA
jgi:hypothetical protein